MVKKRPNIPKHSSNKPSKLLMLFSLLMACLFPYYLVTHFSHPKESNLSHKKIPLPKISPPIRSLPHNTLVESSPTLTETTPPKPSPILPLTTNQNIKLNPIKIEQSSKPSKQPIEPISNKIDRVIYPRKGDSMALIFRRMGLSAKNLHAVMQRNPHIKVLSAIKPSQKLHFFINKNKLEKLIIPMNDIQTLIIYRQGTLYKTKVESKKTTGRIQYLTGTVTGSLYITAKRLNIHPKLISQITQIFNKQIDFVHSSRVGDKFSIAYEAIYVENKKIGIGDIQAVSYTNRGKTLKAIRHTTAKGYFDYFTPQGESLKKAFSRYPVKFSHISSTFSLSRAHPILHYKRAHKGIDLAAPIGTPIQATGDGTISFIGRHNGYGNMVEIKHDNKYSTIYGHMLKFQKGLSKGSRVRRNQVIGYVGQTGLATGPHCHYELHVFNQAKNPTTVGLPIAPPISSRELAAFKRKTNSLFHQLELAAKSTPLLTRKKAMG